ncbi:MAG: hypothetical protein KC432_16845, partial [Thermomicrobiales bacterium]|nr:hypothetical protein [Thermomicrobiales bacterium]
IRAGQLPDEPALPVVNEAAVDPSSVPQGASSLKIILTALPFAGDWQPRRISHSQAVIDRLDRDLIPGLKKLITGTVVMSPVGYARDLLSAIRGTAAHGAMVLYQQGGMRPILGLGQVQGTARQLSLRRRDFIPAEGFRCCQDTMPRGRSVMISAWRPASILRCPGRFEDVRIPSCSRAGPEREHPAGLRRHDLGKPAGWRVLRDAVPVHVRQHDRQDKGGVEEVGKEVQAA